MRSTQRYLILGLAMATVPFTIVVAAPPARADCTYAGGSTVCAQGDGPRRRTACRGPRLRTSPIRCENDWYCDTTGISTWSSDPGRPGRPGGAVVSDHVDE